MITQNMNEPIQPTPIEHKMGKSLILTFWLNRDFPEKHGYTKGNLDEDTIHRFRLGPIVVGWELATIDRGWMDG